VSYWAVTREAGPGWTNGNGTLEQPGVGDHAAFMNALAEDGFVLFAGPLAGTEHGRLRALLIINAESEADIQHRLAEDPWTRSKQLRIKTIEPWNLFIGAERLAAELATSGGRGV
jgi:uncharacterized protein YciI